jgi:peptide deformylase
MIREVILFPDRRLETPCEPVTEFETADLDRLVADLFETMYFHEGIGLAAPQIGIMKQVAVIDPSSGSDSGRKIVLINPRISQAKGSQCGEEGCLSFPGFSEQITRPMSVFVEAWDSKGTAVDMESDGLLSRVLQHEIDHLRGVLFIHHMSALKRGLILRKIRKMIRSGSWGAVRRSA